MYYWILCSLSVLERCYGADKHRFGGTKTLYGHSSLSSLSSFSSPSSPSSFSFPSSFSSPSSWIVISSPHLYSNIYKTFLDDSNFWMKSEDGLGFYMDMNYIYAITVEMWMCKWNHINHINLMSGLGIENISFLWKRRTWIWIKM